LDGVRDVDDREWLLFPIHKEPEGSGSGRHIHLHHHNSSFRSPGGISCLPFLIHPNIPRTTQKKNRDKQKTRNETSYIQLNLKVIGKEREREWGRSQKKETRKLTNALVRWNYKTSFDNSTA
jgi:hypothetical protein